MRNLFFLLILSIPFSLFAQNGYKVGDKVQDFSLLNVKDKSTTALSSFSSQKIVVVIFTSHNCPYSKIYEQRIKNFIQKYEQKTVIFLLINPNNPVNNPEESIEEMAYTAKERDYQTPYLTDPDQAVSDKFGNTKTPEVFVLKNQNSNFILKYKGAMDDNPQIAANVTTNYLQDAIESILSNQPVKISEKKATGCMIHR